MDNAWYELDCIWYLLNMLWVAGLQVTGCGRWMRACGRVVSMSRLLLVSGHGFSVWFTGGCRILNLSTLLLTSSALMGVCTHRLCFELTGVCTHGFYFVLTGVCTRSTCKNMSLYIIYVSHFCLCNNSFTSLYINCCFISTITTLALILHSCIDSSQLSPPFHSLLNHHHTFIHFSTITTCIDSPHLRCSLHSTERN